MRMRTTAMGIATALVLSTALPAPSHATGTGAAPASPGCGDDAVDAAPVPFFLGLRPGDDLSTAWCRVRAIGGKKTLQVEFPETGATRYGSVDLTDGPGAAEIVQRLLPTEGSMAVDADGQPFPKVLRSVSAGTVALAPSGHSLGLPPAFPGARDLALWETLVLRVGTVEHKGSPFVLELVFEPSPAKYLMTGTGKRTGDVFVGETKRMMSSGTRLTLPSFGADAPETDACPDRLPDCGGLGPKTRFSEVWALTKATLRSRPGDLTRTAVELVEALETSHPGTVPISLSAFDPYKGKLSYTRSKEGRRLKVRTVPPKDGYGVASVTVEWSDTKEGTSSWWKAMDEWFRASRSALLKHYGALEATDG